MPIEVRDVDGGLGNIIRGWGIVEVSTIAIKSIAPLHQRAWEFHPDAVVAIAADTDITYGLSRMWESLIDAISWETMVFRSRVDAEAWIKEKVKEYYGIDDLTFS
jgi:hypothetical protein